MTRGTLTSNHAVNDELTKLVVGADRRALSLVSDSGTNESVSVVG